MEMNYTKTALMFGEESKKLKLDIFFNTLDSFISKFKAICLYEYLNYRKISNKEAEELKKKIKEEKKKKQPHGHKDHHEHHIRNAIKVPTKKKADTKQRKGLIVPKSPDKLASKFKTKDIKSPISKKRNFKRQMTATHANDVLDQFIRSKPNSLSKMSKLI